MFRISHLRARICMTMSFYPQSSLSPTYFVRFSFVSTNHFIAKTPYAWSQCQVSTIHLYMQLCVCVCVKCNPYLWGTLVCIWYISHIIGHILVHYWSLIGKYHAYSSMLVCMCLVDFTHFYVIYYILVHYWSLIGEYRTYSSMLVS